MLLLDCILILVRMWKPPEYVAGYWDTILRAGSELALTVTTQLCLAVAVAMVSFISSGATGPTAE